MKKVFLVATIASFSFAAFAQEKMESKDGKMEMKSTMKMKDHVCNKDCKAGKCSYKHGEKGHVCTDACKKMKS